MAMGKRILLTTTGSLGDLHPFMAIGLELQARGHEATLATSNFYRPKIEQAGLKFAPMGPHLEHGNLELMRRVMDQKRGPEFLIRELMYPSIPGAFREVMAALTDSDLIVTHPITYGAQIAAEKTGVPWVSVVTTPMLFYSRYDLPVIPHHLFLSKFRRLGLGVSGLLLKLGRRVTRPWFAPVSEFRKSVGMSPGRDPCFEGQHSPQCVLAIFSRALAEPQPDWPAQTRITGFAFYDQAEHGQALAPELERFLDAGPPPVVFTLGSSAVFQAGNFYSESLEAIRQAGCRAVLLAGSNEMRAPLPPGVTVFPYAPFSRIFQRAAAVVHQAGAGTCGQALAAGKPQLIVPFAFDQLDNAERLQRRGVARTIPRGKFSARRAKQELDRLLSDANYARRATELGEKVRAENGARAAADAIERLLQ